MTFIFLDLLLLWFLISFDKLEFQFLNLMSKVLVTNG